MVSKTAIFLTIAFLIQGYNCKTIDEVINDARPQIAKLQTQISVELRDDQKSIGQTRKLVQESVGNAEKELHNNVKEIREFAKNLEADAKADGRNIGDCLNSLEATLKALDFHAVAKCAKNLDELHEVHNRLDQLGQLKRKLSALIRNCRTQNPTDADKLQICINNELKADKKQLDKVSRQIDNDLKRITDKSLKCIETNLNRLNLALEKAKKDFKTCATAH